MDLARWTGLRIILGAAIGVLASGPARAAALAESFADAYAANGGVPPSWNQTNSTGTTLDQGDILGDGTGVAPAKKAKREPRPWYLPRAALGIGTNVPELLPIEGYLFFGHYFALRGFYAPPLGINLRVEMPSDVIATKSGVAVANPAFNIQGKATYGASYGLEALFFPLGGSFFLSGGVSHRHMRLVADAKSPVLVCSIVEAAKDPPCGDPNASIETRTELTVHADASTDALLLRYAMGWFWHVGSFGYFMFNAGITKPTHISSDIGVSTGLEEPGTSDPEITGALAQVRTEQEAKLRSQALQSMRPVEDKMLPIFGIGAGVRF